MQLCFHCITGTTNPTHSTCHYDASQKDHVEARVAAATPRRRRPAPSARIHRCRCRISTICNSRRPRRRTIRNSITRPSSTCAPRSPMCPLSRWRRWSMRRHEGTMRSPTNRRTPLDHTWNRKRIIGQTKLWDEKNAILKEMITHACRFACDLQHTCMIILHTSPMRMVKRSLCDATVDDKKNTQYIHNR